jgi:CheY-like chemotaxis protein
MSFNPVAILLADDDRDDCLLFGEVLDELPLATSLSIVNNGEELMTFLQKSTGLPDVLFLDLNMPRKNGFECLTEIKLDERLRALPVIIFSTSFDSEIVHLLHKHGAHFYIRKPEEFEALKKAIYQAVYSATQAQSLKPSFDNFVIQS